LKRIYRQTNQSFGNTSTSQQISSSKAILLLSKLHLQNIPSRTNKSQSFAIFRHSALSDKLYRPLTQNATHAIFAPKGSKQPAFFKADCFSAKLVYFANIDRISQR
jgi:hypothetical protein